MTMADSKAEKGQSHLSGCVEWVAKSWLCSSNGDDVADSADDKRQQHS